MPAFAAAPAPAESDIERCIAAPDAPCINQLALAAMADLASRDPDDGRDAFESYGFTIAAGSSDMPLRAQILTMARQMGVEGRELASFEAMGAAGADWKTPLQQGDIAGALDAIPDRSHPMAYQWYSRIFSRIAGQALTSRKADAVVSYFAAWKPAADDAATLRNDMLAYHARQVLACGCADLAPVLALMSDKETVQAFEMAQAALRGNRARLAAMVAVYSPDVKARRPPRGEAPDILTRVFKQAFGQLPDNAPADVFNRLLEAMPYWMSAGDADLGGTLGAVTLRGFTEAARSMSKRHLMTDDSFIVIIDEVTDPDLPLAAIPALQRVDRAYAAAKIAPALVRAKRAREAMALLEAQKVLAGFRQAEEYDGSGPLGDLVQAFVASGDAAGLKALLALLRPVVRSQATKAAAEWKAAYALHERAAKAPLDVYRNRAKLKESAERVDLARRIACENKSHAAYLALAYVGKPAPSGRDVAYELERLRGCMPDGEDD